MNPAPGGDAVISVRDLVAGFGGQTVLNGLNLEVRAGEILGVVGGSGAGKSVLLRSIIGLIRKRSGKIRVFDVDADDSRRGAWRSVERRWGVLFQGGALFSSLTARENIQFPMRQYLDLPDDVMDALAMVKLELVGLNPNDANKLPAELSGGMTKRVALARALALDPEIVFLDEPTSGLDPIAAGAFDVLIRTLQHTLGITVFMVTHDLDSLKVACDRVAALADGKIVAEGPMETLLSSDHPWVKAYFGGRRGRSNGRDAHTNQ
jgi:phospholipid/cholesterol/gamma-HCH transport system ATP-binding protein